MRRVAVLFASGLVACSPAAVARDAPQPRHEVMEPAATIPGESVFQLPLDLALADDTRISMADLRGRPLLVTMFYTSCNGVCPLLAFSMRRTVAALPADQRDTLQVLLVSFDPKRDSPQALREFAHLNQIDRAGWWLAGASEQDVRKLAAVLGIRYRELPGGVFSHSAVIILLDADGVIRAQSTNLQELDPVFIKAIEDTLQ